MYETNAYSYWRTRSITHRAPIGFTSIVTLGDFFAIWSNTFDVNVMLSSNSLLDQTGTIVILETGPLVVSIENPANYQLIPLDGEDEFLTLTLG